VEEGETQQTSPRAGRGLALLLLAILIAAAGALFYGDSVDRFTAGYASWVALLAIPAALGGLLVHLAYPEGDLPVLGCLVWPSLGIVLVAGFAWLAFGEGAICIAMVLPLWLPAAIVGALVNRWNRARADKANAPSRLNSAAWFAFPLLLATGDGLAPPVWRERAVTSETIIAVSPDRLWPLLVSIPAIRPGEGRRNFTQDVLGVPRPTEAVLVERDGHLVRQARWGADIRFEESITEWQENRAIGWRFAFPDD
jgi:hypothetical protein